MCWRRAMDGRPKRSPCGANGWLGCCANCGRCGSSLPKRDQLLLRIGAAKKEAGRAFGFVKIQRAAGKRAGHARDASHFRVDKTQAEQAAEQRDGHYLLRSNLTAEDPAVLWTLERGMLKLPAKYRVVLVLRDLEQLSTEDTAAALGLGIPAIKSRLCRARLMLREAPAPHFAARAERIGL